MFEIPDFPYNSQTRPKRIETIAHGLINCKRERKLLTEAQISILKQGTTKRRKTVITHWYYAKLEEMRQEARTHQYFFELSEPEQKILESCPRRARTKREWKQLYFTLQALAELDRNGIPPNGRRHLQSVS